MSNRPGTSRPLIAAATGLVALASAMGIGRFAFSPMLPLMQQASALGLVEGTHVRLEINSLGQADERLAHRAALIAHFEAHAAVLDDEARRRLHANPLRLLDSKNPAMQPAIEAAPRLLDFLGERSRAHLDGVRAVLDAAGPQLKIVANVAVGYNNIDVPACRARGVAVTNTPDVLTNACADFTWALILAVTRRLGEGERVVPVAAGPLHGVAEDDVIILFPDPAF